MAKSNPLDGKLVVLIGGSGFLGTYLAQELLERGARLRIASREPQRAFKLKPLGMLGQIQFIRCDVRKEESIRRAMQGADAAAYLVGSFSGDLKALHTDGAAMAARAARDEGAAAFVQISAIGANANAQSTYARTKAEGENAVREAFPEATILRPSVLFGEEDRFINLFAGLVRSFRFLPVFGAESRLQPLWVDDAAEAAADALANPAEHGGKIYEIAGPEIITVNELHQRIAVSQARKRSFVPVSDSLARLFASLPGTPMNADQWTMLKSGNVASSDFPGLKEFGITPKPLGLFLDHWMTRYRKRGRFEDKLTTVR